MASRKAVVEALRLLAGERVKFVLIGETIFDLLLGRQEVGDYVEIYALRPDPIMEEEKYYEIADRLGWGIGQTWLGTPLLEARIGDERIEIAVLGNHFEFSVPDKMLSDARKERVDGLRLQMIPPEAYLVLKAAYLQESELRELKQLGGKIGVSPRKIAEYLESLPMDIRRVAHRKLLEAGFRISV
ncbi:MAG: nucleotidyltransferase [Desulfurococcales archaeon]|nr:nucleotidyltransferase [Desulfurococcales archaeon]